MSTVRAQNFCLVCFCTRELGIRRTYIHTSQLKYSMNLPVFWSLFLASWNNWVINFPKNFTSNFFNFFLKIETTRQMNRISDNRKSRIFQLNVNQFKLAEKRKRIFFRKSLIPTENRSWTIWRVLLTQESIFCFLHCTKSRSKEFAFSKV